MGVLLVVRDLGARRLCEVPARGEAAAGRLRRLVRVHLVTEEEQYVRAYGAGVGGEPGGKGVEGVGTGGVPLADGGSGPAAGAEGDPDGRRLRVLVRRGGCGAYGGVVIVLAGKRESSSGQTFRPPSSTSYAVVEPGVRSVTTTSA